MKQITDFRAEVDELAAILAPLDDGRWDTITQFKGYTIADVVRHLHQGDNMGLASIAGPEAFAAMRARREARRAGGVSSRDDARLEFGHLNGRALLDIWLATARNLAGRLAELPPETRLTWSGPDMGLRMFATARQMEVWAHGQEISDILGVARTPTDRLENIVVIGVRTFGWTFRNRGMPVPPEPPHIRLVAPSGAVWQWHETSGAGRVNGSALDFAEVVTQVRNVADTTLEVEGETARAWMAIAQCFAGPPEDPPTAGLRHRVAAAG